MSIDMQQFNAVFFEEVAEHLSNMESLLLDIDVTAPDLEDLNAIFRAAHSIKGGAGIFGFNDMTAVTHILETLLDKLRKEELTLTTEMIDAFLKAGDILAAQKKVHQEGGEALDEEKVNAICRLLEALSCGECTAQPETEIQTEPEVQIETEAQTETEVQIQTETQIETPSAPEAIIPAAPTVNLAASCAVKQISFLVASGEDADNLLEELAQYGQLSQSFEVVHGFTKWRLTLAECTLSDEELFDNISFIAEPDSILIMDVEEKEDCFVFFEDDAPVTRCADTEQGFGFFDDDIKLDPSNEVPYSEPELSCAENNTPESSATNTQAVPTHVEKAASVVTEAQQVLVKNNAVNKPTSKVATPQKSSKHAASKALANAETSIRVNTEKVDQLINQVGELVITQAMLTQIAHDLDPSEHDTLLNRITQLERNTRDLQESVMSIRMMPISFVFGRFPRVVRDLSSQLNKKIELRLVGDQTELDKGIVEQLADPLTHLIRNSIDHGIEMPDQRIANGKPETGVITLFAFYEGGSVVINISDDGAGLNRNKIVEKALQRGMEISDCMSDSDIYQLIFSAGFSTADKVTDVSGRGVGMDVVKRNIHTLGGQVEIHSEAGIGSTISIRLPLTLAILDGMSISVAGQVYIIPLAFIAESLQPKPEDIKSINGLGTVVKVRGDYIPLLALHALFNIDTEIKQASDGILVLLTSNNKKIALLVDQLEGQQQVVLKSLETNFRAVPYISGATIMGDGAVALILDVAALVSARD